MRKTIAGLVLTLALASCATQPVNNGTNASSSSSSTAMNSSTTGESSNTTGLPLNVPAGFSIETLAKNIPGARVIVKDGFGNYWVSQTEQGTITQLEMKDGKVVSQNAIFRNLNRPHGLAIDPSGEGFTLYIAESDKISRVQLYSDGPMEKIADMPGIGRHYTRTVGFGTDGKLYVSIGSTCDVCMEKDERNGSIMRMNPDGSDIEFVAKGLRNSVFFTWKPGTDELWATDMGRDMLGDELPPEDVNVIEMGKHYGWPYCYGDRVRDTAFQAKDIFDCSATEPPRATLPAHSAPLGLAFIPSSWPAEYRGDLLVAAHGSWNRSVKIGYEVERISLTSSGNPESGVQKFLDGWLQNGSVLGRPVDLMFDGDALLLTDDKTGSVYRMRPTP
jgi:glucose/arabinose dehydrogenase